MSDGYLDEPSRPHRASCIYLWDIWDDYSGATQRTFTTTRDHLNAWTQSS